MGASENARAAAGVAMAAARADRDARGTLRAAAAAVVVGREAAPEPWMKSQWSFASMAKGGAYGTGVLADCRAKGWECI